MAYDGIIATDMHTGSVDGETFSDFVRGSLIPQMQAFDGRATKPVAVMDNYHSSYGGGDICSEKQE